MREMKIKILVVEDDPVNQTLIEQSLKGHALTFAESVAAAKKSLEAQDFEIVLLDIGLPDGDGLKFFASDLKPSVGPLRPILFLSGHADISNKIMAFSLGADDFIVKPFDPLELRARVESKHLKIESQQEKSRERVVGDVTLDMDRQQLKTRSNGREEKSIDVTAIEFKILVMLTRRLEVVYSREQILESIWGATHISDRTVDSHIAHLRSKLKDTSLLVETVKGSGYRATVKR